MPVLRRLSVGGMGSNGEGSQGSRVGWVDQQPGPGPSRLLTTCANPGCSSGWLHLLRSRSAPVVEGGWSCSPSCTEARVAVALRRELGGRRVEASLHRHRIPLGLMMLEQGWITSEQLRKGLDAQRAAGQGRLGTWLVEELGVREQLVTRALSMQWGCPVLALEYHDADGMAAMLPRFFVEAYAALPLRAAAGKILYLGFEDRLDPVLSLAVERMTGLSVEAGLVSGSRFRVAHERLLRTDFPKVEHVEGASKLTLVHVLSERIERAKPVEARFVRVHGSLWLRMWRKLQQGPVARLSEVEDVVVSLEAN